ncbi:heterokaryon incompatibility protein-domain-containing protein [Dactylonectria macrodidyma]|uniref:Heterokaryon incompatibility protein-domain-containing protein n=1 Tax=Dactylonectria macrodidyma TaxID=307937 RepID=A0A9P9JNE7_9HYPO|nr:heterokaryon incompatibility protein-domain-containing protein [Dactylonectria macrodidyma]
MVKRVQPDQIKMASPTEYYQHQPLPTHRYIRVLRLQPNPSRDAELRCSLVPVSLDESPKYWALSYTWDAQAPSHPIICQKGGSIAKLDITPNCAAALRQLRDTTEERTLWVDGICINQASLQERSGQVALMGEIYLAAEQVVVWLGESDPASKQAIDLLKRIGDLNIVHSITQDASKDPIDLEARRRAREQVHANARELTKDTEDKISPLFRRNWFHRMWTVQEVVLPTGPKVEVYCGDSSIDWLTLWLATDVLSSIKYKLGDWEPAIRLQRYLSQMMTRHREPELKRMMNSIPGLELDLTISLLLIFCRPKLATDPKDKVYALYGLLNYFGVELSKPDYEKPLAEIYAEITAASIKHDKNLFALNYVASDSRRSGLPSWVPDWSDIGWEQGDPRGPVTRGRFAASGSAEPRWKFTSNPQELIVYGKVVGTVIYRADSFVLTPLPSIPELTQRDATGRIIVSESLRNTYNIYKIMKEWVGVAYRAGSYPTGENLDNALKTTLLNDYPSNNADPRANGFHEWLASMRATEAELTVKAAPLAMLLGATPVPQVGLRTVVGALFRPSRYLAKREQRRQQVENDVPIELRTMLAMTVNRGWGYHSLAQLVSARKSFFRTDGGYFGTAPDMFPDSLQSGDVVALVAGLAMPVVLRKVESGFHLVSHCYVHGMMYGDVWERVEGQIDELTLI